MKLKVGSGFVKKVHKVKSHTHVKGTFLFGIYCWTRFIKKLLKMANKKQNNFDIYKKKQINTWRYDYQNLDDMIEQNRLKLVILGHLLSFNPPPPKKKKKTLKNQNFEKMIKLLEISFYTFVPKSTIIWCTVPEIESKTLWVTFWAIFCPFTPLPTRKIEISKNKNTKRYYHFTHVHHKWCMVVWYDVSYDVWFLRFRAQPAMFDHSGPFFLPFYPSTNQTKQNFKKLKTRAGDIIILDMCTKNHDHMLYCSWDTTCDGCNFFLFFFFSFWAIFCTFTPT